MTANTAYFKQMIPDSDNDDNIECVVPTYQGYLLSFYHRKIPLYA